GRDLAPALREADKSLQEFSLLYNQSPARRPAQKVEAVQAALSQSAGELQKARDRLRSTSPFASPDMQRLQGATLALVAVLVDLAQGGCDYLKKGQNATHVDEVRIKESIRKKEEADAAWDEAYRKAMGTDH